MLFEVRDLSRGDLDYAEVTFVNSDNISTIRFVEKGDVYILYMVDNQVLTVAKDELETIFSVLKG